MTLSRLIESARGIAGAAREGAGMDVDLIFEIHRKLTPMNAVALADALVSSGRCSTRTRSRSTR
jgi:hypothetical protein